MEEIFEFLGLVLILSSAIAWLIKQIVVNVLNKDIEAYKNELKEESEKRSINYKEKIELYKSVSEPIIKLIAEIEQGGKVSLQTKKDFNLKRLEIITQLTMFAPDYVFHSFNDLIDYLYNCFENKEEYSFIEFRNRGLKVLSNIRKDIGIYEDELEYQGNR